MKAILACTDGSQYSGSVYEHAAWAAKQSSAPAVRVLHVLERQDVIPTGDLTGSLGFDANAELMEELVRLDEAQSRVARLRGSAILEDAKKQLQEAGVENVEGLQRHGGLVDTLDELEGEAGLVVLGKRGEHANFSKGHLGSGLERVARSAKVPVLVASRAYESIDSFLLAFDGGESGLKAVQYAAANPLLQGLHCHLVSVGKADSKLSAELADAATILQNAGYEVTADLLQGDVEDTISEEVKKREIGLLVMGAYGHSKIRRLMLGSTTTALIRDCHVPVLLFR